MDKMKKGALLLSGQLRSFTQTWQKISEFVKFNNLDVYCHNWQESNVNLVNEVLIPTKQLIENYDVNVPLFEEMQKEIQQKNPKNLVTPDKLINSISLHYGKRKAFELVNLKYDFFVSTRYDIDIKKEINVLDMINAHPDQVITPSEHSYGMVSDIFSIIPNKFASDYFLYPNIVDLFGTPFSEGFIKYLKELVKISESNIEIHNKQRYCPHMLILKNYFEKNIYSLLEGNLSLSIQR
jgi:hypothetical protein